MIVTLIYNDKLYSITLPNKKEGQFFIGPTSNKELIRIIGDKENWILKSNKKVKIQSDENEDLKTIELKEQNIYYLNILGKESYIFCEPHTADCETFTKYAIEENMTITIGRENENSITFSKPFISSIHGVLTYHNKYWTIEDKDSTNGIFVNGCKTEKGSLDFGDVIYIMGMKIIVGYDFFAINNPDNKVSLDKNLFTLKEFTKIEEESESEDEDEIDIKYFYRSPRLKRNIDTKNFKVDAPPHSMSKEKLPAMLTVGPMFTMGLASLTSTIFTMNSAFTSGSFTNHIPSIAMSASMLLSTMLWPTVTKKYENKQNKNYDLARDLKYKEYLKTIEDKIKKEIEDQRSILKETLVSIDECEDRILNTSRSLWERSLGAEDSLKLRVGLGNVPFKANITYPEHKFSIEEDELTKKMYELCETPKILENVPVSLSIHENYISGVIGEKKKVIEFAKGLMIELVSLYSYDEVKTVFIYNEEDKNELEFVKWLPHTFSNDKKFRFIATNASECKELSYYLESEVQMRSDVTDKDMEILLPYYVIFVLDSNLGIKTEILKNIYSKKKNLNISVLNFYEKLEHLPKECSTVIELEENNAKMYDKNDIQAKMITFKPDINLTADPMELSKKLANTYLDTLESGYKLPSVVEFLDMFKSGKLEHLNILNRWNENDPTKSLATPVGMNSYGELFYLDLHEKFHGPHGLVAGMTGSGKSEFIITYILSLAVNYHPHEVSFILIDYKGGGMAKSFANLPHTAGIITNLDGASINRTLTSIKSELKRRQSIFDDTSQKLGISNIDIYKYQKLYRSNDVKTPLPHLFIISDEFAELKSERPEFMAELISAARIGRSLGIHLILATQKPSGVVDDQIWSNSKFRVCLKVQEKSDSMDMLKRPDAALLKDTGRFYLQVGYNELFELGQSAWAGAPYHPNDSYIEDKDDSVVVIDNNAHSLKSVRLEKNSGLLKNSPKQLEAVTKYIKDVAKIEKIKSLPIWLPPLDENILYSDLIQKYESYEVEPFILNPIIGELDDPVMQRQTYISLPLNIRGNVLIYSSIGSGEELLISMLVYSLIKNHSPQEVNLYLLDFASETLTSFKDAPHIGDVILSHDTEKVPNLFKNLYKEIEKRKKEFANYGGSYNSYIKTSGKTVPNIVITISNFAAFQELYSNEEDILNYLVREGSRYGIYFVITANGANSVKYKTSQNFPQVLTLNLNDESMYSMILGRTEGLVPQNSEGRGLIKIDKNIYEFQTAKITLEASFYNVIEKECKNLQKESKGYQANSVKVLPEVVTKKLLKPYISEKLIIPIGMKKNNLDISYLDLENNYVNLVISSDKSYVPFIGSLINFISENYKNCELNLIDLKGEVENLKSKTRHIVKYDSSIADELYNLVLERNNKFKDAVDKQVAKLKFEPVVYFINSYTDLIEGRSLDEIEKINLALEKGSTSYGVYFIIFEREKKVSVLNAKKWYQDQVKLENGLWFGNGFSNQYTFNVTSKSSDTKDDIKENFAISINKGTASLIKIISEDGE